MKRAISLIIILTVFFIVALLPTTVSLCNKLMQNGTHNDGHGFAHQLVNTCQPTEWTSWLARFSSSFWGGVLFLLYFCLVVVFSLDLQNVNPPNFSRLEKHRHQRSPYDFLLEFFSQGILHPRTPRLQ